MKATSKAGAGSKKSYAEEFEWVGGRAVQKKEGREQVEGKARRDEWGVKQKEAWGVV